MRDQRGRSASPRRLGAALDSFRSGLAPATPLAAVIAVWRDVVGDGIAAVTSPVSEREGVVTVECASATWAEELTLMEPELRSRLTRATPEAHLVRLVFRTA